MEREVTIAMEPRCHRRAARPFRENANAAGAGATAAGARISCSLPGVDADVGAAFSSGLASDGHAGGAGQDGVPLRLGQERAADRAAVGADFHHVDHLQPALGREDMGEHT